MRERRDGRVDGYGRTRVAHGPGIRALVLSAYDLGTMRDGGRVLTANEIRALAAVAERVDVIAFTRTGCEAPDLVDDPGRLGASSYTEVLRPSFPTATRTAPWLPYQLASRRISRDLLRGAVAREPDVIVAHFEWTVPAAVAIRDAIRAAHGYRPPVVLRRHNDERAFWGDAWRNTAGPQKAYNGLERLRMSRRRMTALASQVDAVWALTAQDLLADGAGTEKSVLPPALIEDRSHRDDDLGARGRVAAYLGSLDHGANVEGLLWFVDEVWPAVHARTGGTLAVMGRGASPALASRLGGAAGVRFVGEVDDPAAALEEARLFVNPVRLGSGLNVKLGRAIESGLPIVTTSFGARGFDGDRLLVADDPGGLAEHCSRVPRR